MRIVGMGRVLFALAFVALGLLSLFSRDFAFVWQPVPADIPGRALLACLSGIILCVMGATLLIGRTAVAAALALTFYTFIWLLLLHVPLVIASPLQESTWAGAGEIATLVGASWILYASSAMPQQRFHVAWLAGARAMRGARILFAVGIILVGLEHLVYASSTADYVPAWLPGRLGWAYFTGVAHIAAGIAILFTVLPRLGAALETSMMGIFTVLVWIPMVIATPMQRFDWTALLMSTLITAAAWIVADSYRDMPWRWRKRAAHFAAR